jgi:hypothetical protein
LKNVFPEVRLFRIVFISDKGYASLGVSSLELKLIVELGIAVRPDSTDSYTSFFNFKLSLALSLIARDSSLVNKPVRPQYSSFALCYPIDDSPLVVVLLLGEDDSRASTWCVLLPVTLAVVGVFLVDRYFPGLNGGNVRLVVVGSCFHAEVLEVIVLYCALATGVTHLFLFELIKPIKQILSSIKLQEETSDLVSCDGLSDPLDSFVKMPDPFSTITALHIEPAFSMSLPIQPWALIAATIRPGKDSPAMLGVTVVLSFIFAAIWPRVSSMTMHLIVLPVSFVDPSIAPAKCSLSFVHLMEPFSLIVATIFPFEFSPTVLFASHKLAFVARSVRPLVQSFSPGQVIPPRPDILRAISFQKSSLSVGLVSHKASLVDVFVGVVEGAFTTGIVIDPISFVPIPVWPFLNSITVLLVILNLPFIDNISTEDHC